MKKVIKSVVSVLLSVFMLIGTLISDTGIERAYAAEKTEIANVIMVGFHNGNTTNITSPLEAKGCLIHKWSLSYTSGNGCTTDIVEHYTCTKCGNTKTKTVQRANGSHSYSAATCTSAKKCTRCGATSGSALGHNYGSATCTSAKKCTRCGATSGSALGHSWGSWVIDDRPTCTIDGAKHRTCTRCGAFDQGRESATGHNWTAATCTSPKKCTKCGTTSGSALGHLKSGSASCTSSSTCSRCGTVLEAAWGHSWMSATCTSPKKCDRCGATSGSALGHNFSAATCTSAKKCTRCGATSGNALGHSWGSWVIDDRPTCTIDGAKHRTCTRCGAFDQGRESATGHNWTEATCTSPKKCTKCGTTSGSALGHLKSGSASCTSSSTCSRCGTVLEAAWGHSWISATCTSPKTCDRCGATSGTAPGHSWGEWVIDETMTCTSDGAKHRNCRRCGAFDQGREIAPGHNWSAWSITQTVNCEQDGIESRSCSRCSETESRVYAKKNTDHAWGEWVIDEIVTCVYDGASHRNCKRCGAFDQGREIAPGHNWSAWSITQTVNCKQDGIESRSCSRCSETESRVYEKKFTDHKWGAWEIEEERSCVYDGSRHRTCLSCGKFEQEKIPSFGNHAWGEWVVNPNLPCTSPDKKYRDCTRCSIREKATPKVSHNLKTTIVKATSTKDGSKTIECTNEGCNYKITETLHYVDIASIRAKNKSVALDCLDNEYTFHNTICTACGKKFDVTLSKKELTDNGFNIEIQHVGKLTGTDAGTCSQKSVKHYLCTACGEKYTVEGNYNANYHQNELKDYVLTNGIKRADGTSLQQSILKTDRCFEDAVVNIYCDCCGKYVPITFTFDEVIYDLEYELIEPHKMVLIETADKGHKYSCACGRFFEWRDHDWIYDRSTRNDPIVCTEIGETYRKCSCGYSEKITEKLAEDSNGNIRHATGERYTKTKLYMYTDYPVGSGYEQAPPTVVVDKTFHEVVTYCAACDRVVSPTNPLAPDLKRHTYSYAYRNESKHTCSCTECAWDYTANHRLDTESGNCFTQKIWIKKLKNDDAEYWLFRVTCADCGKTGYIVTDSNGNLTSDAGDIAKDFGLILWDIVQVAAAFIAPGGEAVSGLAKAATAIGKAGSALTAFDAIVNFKNLINDCSEYKEVEELNEKIDQYISYELSDQRELRNYSESPNYAPVFNREGFEIKDIDW